MAKKKHRGIMQVIWKTKREMLALQRLERGPQRWVSNFCGGDQASWHRFVRGEVSRLVLRMWEHCQQELTAAAGPNFHSSH